MIGEIKRRLGQYHYFVFVSKTI